MTYSKLLCSLLTLAIAACPVAPASAASASLIDPVPGHAAVTWFGLLAKAVPGLALAGDRASGEVQVDYPHVGGEKYTDLAPTSVDLRTISYERVEVDGADHLVLLASLGEIAGEVASTELLALFDADLQFLDAVQVGFSSSTAFREPALLRIGPRDEAIATTSEHFNSNQTYTDTALLFVRDGTLQLVDAIFSFSDRACNYQQQQRLSISTGEGDGAEYWPIIATLIEMRTVTDECEIPDGFPPAFSRRVAVTYSWDAATATYVADSDALEEVARQSRLRF